LPHDVPLSSAALAIVEAVPKQKERDRIFGSREGAFSGWSKSKAALDARIGADINRRAGEAGEKPKPMPEWRLHDIRRTVATRLADLGTMPHVVEAILNHVSGHRTGVAGIYNRATYATEKRAALDLWAEHLSELINATGGSGK
jgi:integrase